MHIDGLWLVTVMRSHLIFQFTFFVFFLDMGLDYWAWTIPKKCVMKTVHDMYISFLTSALYALNTFNSINHEWLCVPYSKYILIPDLFFMSWSQWYDVQEENIFVYVALYDTFGLLCPFFCLRQFAFASTCLHSVSQSQSLNPYTFINVLVFNSCIHSCWVKSDMLHPFLYYFAC